MQQSVRVRPAEVACNGVERQTYHRLANSNQSDIAEITSLDINCSDHGPQATPHRSIGARRLMHNFTSLHHTYQIFNIFDVNYYETVLASFVLATMVEQRVVLMRCHIRQEVDINQNLMIANIINNACEAKRRTSESISSIDQTGQIGA